MILTAHYKSIGGRALYEPMAKVPRLNLTPDCFPMTIQALDIKDGTVVWQTTLEGPGNIYIPPVAERIGRKVRIRITLADGTFEESGPRLAN